MTKKDINFIKHIKPIVKARAAQDKENSWMSQSMAFRTKLILEHDESKSRKEDTCKRAAKMSPYQRLLYYFGTGDATYIGSECDWDIATQMGYNQRRGGL
jgi:hypothetical protein